MSSPRHLEERIPARPWSAPAPRKRCRPDLATGRIGGTLDPAVFREQELKPMSSACTWRAAARSAGRR
jgi:hypothetical protein